MCAIQARFWRGYLNLLINVVCQVDDKIFCIHGGLSPDLNSMEQIRRILRPTDVPDTGLLCDVLWADPDPNIRGWAESDRGVSFTFGADIVEKFNRKHVSERALC